MKNLILILFVLSAYYVLADICKNGEKLKLEDGLFMKCKNNIWKAVEKRAGPGGPPCEDNPTLAANGTCSMQRGDCKQFTEKGLEMDRDCAGTCSSCDTCQCKDNSAWHRFCPFWASYCSSPGVLGTWMTTNCKKTCGRCRCKCCSYNGKQHSLGARIPLADKCGEMVCKEGLVAGSSPLLPGASQHPVSHPEELTLTFTILHTGAECCVLPVDAVGDNGASVTNGTMVQEGWKGTTNTQHGQIALTCCHGSLQVPLEGAMMIPATSTTTESTTTMTSTTTTTTMTSTNTAMIRMHSSNGQALFKVPIAYGTTINTGVVPDTCEAAGLKAVCAGGTGCGHNYVRCQVAEIESDYSISCTYSRGLAKLLCAGEAGEGEPTKCPQMHGLFIHLKAWSGGECGVMASGTCVQGKTYTSTSGTPFYAYCMLSG